MNKNNGEIIRFLRKKDYVMINNDLGSGSFGKTVVIKDEYIDEVFVAKKYEPEYPELKKEFYTSFLQEIKIMYKINHPNIVRIYNYYAYEESYTGYIIMEYIDGKNIDKLFEDEDFFSVLLFEDTKKLDNIFIQLIDGFCFLEKMGIMHRDIREGNILVDKNYNVKIIDFGFGKLNKTLVSSYDSKNENNIGLGINRNGLLALPNEFFEGNYYHKTDMFYLAELFKRLLTKHKFEKYFSYMNILDKMMEIYANNRFKNFEEIKAEINTKNFKSVKISSTEKKIYQKFSNSINDKLICFIGKQAFIRSIKEFKEKLENILKNNRFEDFIQNNADLISTIVKPPYEYNAVTNIEITIISEFYEWYINKPTEFQELILDNLIIKLSYKKVKPSEPDLPF